MKRDSVTWITGASSGIGEALAVACAGDGHHLVISARREAELDRVAQRCLQEARNGIEVLVLPLDVTDEGAMPEAVRRVVDRFGRIDLLINNAGIGQRSYCLETAMAVYRKILDVDVLGQIALTRAVLPTMLEEGSGHIAIVSSIAGKIGVPYRTAYCAAKFAVLGFFDALRAELSGTGIRITSILPGFVRTNISVAAMTGDGQEFGRTDQYIANGMDPDKCAKVILKGLKKGKPEFVVGDGPERWTPLLKRIFPGAVRHWAAKIGKPE